MRGSLGQAVFGSSLSLAIAGLVSSSVGMLINLGMPFFLESAEYVQYSLLISGATLCNSLIFEWLRVGVIRFGHLGEQNSEPNRRHCLVWGYAALLGFLVGLTLINLLLAVKFRVAEVAAVAIGLVASQAFFEGYQAEMRVRGRNASYVTRLLIRSGLSLIGTTTLAYKFGSADAVALGWILSYVVGGLVDLGNILRMKQYRRPALREFAFFARFGMLTGLGTNISLAAPTIIRWLLAHRLGMEVAGGVILAIDLSQRVLTTLTSAIGIVTVQRAINAVLIGNREEMRNAVHNQIILPIILSVPAIVAFMLSLDDILRLIPEQFRDGFAQYGPAAMVAVGILVVRQYSLDPLFVIFGKSAAAPVGPLATLACLGIGAIATSRPEWRSPLIIILLLIGAGSVGAIVTLLLLVRRMPVNWPVRDAGRLLVATIAATLAGYFIPGSDGDQIMLTIGRVFVSVLTFCVCMDLRSRRL